MTTTASVWAELRAAFEALSKQTVPEPSAQVQGFRIDVEHGLAEMAAKHGQRAASLAREVEVPIDDVVGCARLAARYAADVAEGRTARYVLGGGPDHPQQREAFYRRFRLRAAQGAMVAGFVAPGADVEQASDAWFNALLEHRPRHLMEDDDMEIDGLERGVPVETIHMPCLKAAVLCEEFETRGCVRAPETTNDSAATQDQSAGTLVTPAWGRLPSDASWDEKREAVETLLQAASAIAGALIPKNAIVRAAGYKKGSRSELGRWLMNDRRATAAADRNFRRVLLAGPEALASKYRDKAE